MSILSGHAIVTAIVEKEIVIDPFDPNNINPASVDLTLGNEILTYNGSKEDYDQPLAHDRTIRGKHIELDCRKQNHVDRHRMLPTGALLLPGYLYLMHTRERIFTEKYVSVIDGKSSLARLGIVCHLTAGYGDPGFEGQYTLEVTVVHQVWVVPGMRFCQIRFHELSGAPTDYRETGNYVGSASLGPVASKCHKQFEKKNVPA